MAKKHKKLSKRKQVELLKKQGLSFKQARRIDKENREKISDLIIAESDTKTIEKAIKKASKPKPKKTKKSSYDTFKYRVSQKRQYLDSIGVKGALERGVFSDKKIDSIRQKDIENNNVSRETYPWIEWEFDWNKIYTLPDNKRLFIAFRDYQGELDFSTELNFNNNLSISQLLDRLNEIVKKPHTYDKGSKIESSGRAGDYRYTFASQKTIEYFNKEVYSESLKDKRYLDKQKHGDIAFYKTKKGRKKKRAQFKGEKVGFQVLKDGNRVSHDAVTPRNLLVIANTIMWNVTEKDRTNFYNRFYEDFTKIIPDLKKYLPSP